MKNWCVFVVCLAMVGCKSIEGPDCHIRLDFQNKTDKVVWMDFQISYPDTLNLPSPRGNPSNQYKGYTSRKYVCSSSGKECCWESFYKSFNSRGADTLMFFVFDDAVLGNNKWDDVVTDHMILQRYDLSLGDMRALDWTLSYPPDERMKGIKMWPPYGSK